MVSGDGSLLSELGHIYDNFRKNWSFLAEDFWCYCWDVSPHHTQPLGGPWDYYFLTDRKYLLCFPSWMLHKTQGNHHLYLLLLIFVLPHFIGVESFLNFSHQLSRQASLNTLGVYSVAQACCLSVFLKVWEVWVRPWETSLWQQCPCWAERIGEPRSNYRASCVLAGAATHHNMCVFVCEKHAFL